jgi:hypothetical protein
MGSNSTTALRAAAVSRRRHSAEDLEARRPGRLRVGVRAEPPSLDLEEGA